MTSPRPAGVEIPHTHFTLDNGLDVFVHEDPTRPLVSVNVWYHVGSKNEDPGRTGFAHLVEHLMFEGSAHVPPGAFDAHLERAGAVNNGSTNPDRTNYWENLPPAALELALWLESDRMGWLLDAVDRKKLDVQRDVVMNERRQMYDNRSYGRAAETLLELLYPDGHPYGWPTIGTMDDLAAARLDDVTDFVRAHYGPANASVAVAGQVTVGRVRELVGRYFGPVEKRPEPPTVEAGPASLETTRRRILEDDVELPRLYMGWHTAPVFTAEDGFMDMAADVLADGKGARIHRRLVYRDELAQSLTAYQDSGELGSVFRLIATARPGVGLDVLEAAVREELDAVAVEGVETDALRGTRVGLEADFVRRLDRVGGFGGKADALNEYHALAGRSDFAATDLDRFRSATPDDVTAVVRRDLAETPAAVLSVVPRGRRDLGAGTEGGP